jgi:NAD(P)-dependent dehydrogenase (short-subunit alcohol dehydrogenase family)
MMKVTTENMMGRNGSVGYSWAKQAIVRYVEVLALQLARYMLRLNAIYPANVDTQLVHNDDIYRAFRPDLENPTREDAVPSFPAMQSMAILFVDPSDVSAPVALLANGVSR